MDLKKLNLHTLDANEKKQVNGGNGIHGAGYSVAQGSGASGAFHVGTVYGFFKTFSEILFK